MASHMKIVCAWCGKEIGEKPPYEDKSVTHGICDICVTKFFPHQAEKIVEFLGDEKERAGGNPGKENPMSLSKEEISDIAREAAEKHLTDECLTIASDIDSVREDALDPLHTSIYDYGVMLSKGDVAETIVKSEKNALLLKVKGAQDAVKRSIIGTGYAEPEDVRDVTEKLKRVQELIEQDKLYEAMNYVEYLSDDVFHLMLRTVVTCEFQVGKGANPGSEYITIVDPGNTTFKPGEVISKEAFDKENERVKRLGESPATGR